MAQTLSRYGPLIFPSIPIVSLNSFPPPRRGVTPLFSSGEPFFHPHLPSCILLIADAFLDLSDFLVFPFFFLSSVPWTGRRVFAWPFFHLRNRCPFACTRRRAFQEFFPPRRLHIDPWASISFSFSNVTFGKIPRLRADCIQLSLILPSPSENSRNCPAPPLGHVSTSQNQPLLTT